MPEPHTPKEKKKWLMTTVRIVVSVGLLGLLFYKIGPDKIVNAVRAADPWMVVVIFALLFAEHVHGTYKWMILLRHTASHVPFWPMLKIRYLSAFIGTFGLGAVTIELVRMYGLARYTSDLAMSFTSILMDRLLGLTGLSMMILIGVMMDSKVRTSPIIEYWTVGIGIERLVFLALLLLLAGWLSIMNPTFRKLTDKMLSAKWLGFVRDKQNKVYQSLDTYRGRPGLLAWGMVQSLIFNVLRIVVVWAGAMAVGIELPTSAYFIVVPVVIFAMLIPISMAGWGVREVMFVSLFAIYGADGDTVLAMSLLVGFCAVLSTLPGAVILMTGTAIPKPNGGLSTPGEQA